VAGKDRSQKTEKPTPRRLKEAREKGQIARSPELAAWTGMLLATVLLEQGVRRGGDVFSALLREMGRVIASPSEARASAFAGHAATQGALVAAPLVLGLTLLAIVVNLAQVGLKPSWKRLKPQFSRVNVLKGLKRLASPTAWWELAKSAVKVSVLAAVAWPTAMALAHSLTGHGGSLFFVAGQTARTSIVLVRNVAGVGLVIAAVDYLVQRRRVAKDLMMSKQEIAEEMKQHEGDPRLRQAIRSRQASISRNRMIRMVSLADVVVVNPTHYAVALKYDSTRGAPEVVAKGADHLAARIRLEATRHDVPIVHEPTVTRALYRACPIGARIPVELYEAVAHLLAFVYALRAKGRGPGFHELGRELVPDQAAPDLQPA
jgi:flagellar biosynthesis protein FlhB